MSGNGILKTSYNKEDDSEYWHRIKDFVGGRNKDPKHPIVEEAERQQRRQPAHFDEGGQVDPIIPQVGIPSVPETNFDQKASNIMGGITPEAIQRLSDSLNRRSRASQIGAGIAGLGDAIQSVGGIKGEHMKNAEDQIMAEKESALKLPMQMASVGKENYALSKDLQENDPHSKMAENFRETYGPLAKKMGLDISTATPKLISDLMGKSIDQMKNESEAALAKEVHGQTAAYQSQNLDLQRKALENTAENQQAERLLQGQKLASDQEKERQETASNAAKSLAGQGFFKSIMSAVGGPGHAANKVLQEQMQGDAKKIGPEDVKAINWAFENPNDPRAKKILSLHGI